MGFPALPTGRAHSPSARRLGRKAKVFNHPAVGRITLTYQAFNGHYLLVGTAEPGSTDADSPTLLGSPHPAGHRDDA